MKNCPDLSYYYFNSSTLPRKISIMRSRQTNKTCRKNFGKAPVPLILKSVLIAKHFLATVKIYIPYTFIYANLRYLYYLYHACRLFYRNRLFVYIHYSKAPFKTHKQECNDCFLRAEFAKGEKTPLLFLDGKASRAMYNSHFHV
jgi:hypothetical protein